MVHAVVEARYGRILRNCLQYGNSTLCHMEMADVVLPLSVKQLTTEASSRPTAPEGTVTRNS